MSASGGSIRIMLDALGVQNVQEATRAIQALRQAAGALQGSAGTPFEPFVGPMTGLGQQRGEMESHLRTVTDMWKNVQGLNTDLERYYQNVLNVGNAYGYQRDQMIAVRQELQAIQSLAGQDAAQQNVLGFSRGYGLNPTQTAASVGSFYQSGVLSDPSSQQQFSFMLADAVAQGSRGGMNVMMDRFLPILQSLTERQLAMTPTGANAEGIAQVLTRFNASGIPGFRNEGGMAAYQGLDQGIRGATQGFPAAVFMDALGQGDPNYNYAQYVQDIAGGASDPESRKRILTAIYRMGPQGNDQNAQNYRALYAQQLLPNMDPATLKAMFSTFFDAQGNYLDDPALGGLSSKYGGTASMDPTYLAMLAKVDQAQTPEQLQQVQKDFRTLTGRDLGAKTTGDFTRDQQAIGQAIAAQTQPAMGTQADQMDKSRADAAKAFEDAQKELFIFNQAIRDTNTALAHFTEWLVAHGGGGPLFAANTAAQVGGAVLGAGANMALAYNVFRLLRGGGAVAPTLAAGGAGAVDALGFGVPAAGGGAAAAAGGGMTLAGVLGVGSLAALGAAAVAGGAGAESWGYGQAIRHGANPFVAPGGFVQSATDIMAAPYNPLAMMNSTINIGRAGLGLARNAGFQGWDWMNRIPGAEGVFGHFGDRSDGAGGATGATGKLADDPTNADQRRQTDTLDRLNQVLGLLATALLNGQSVPTGTAYDQALQASFGGGTRPAGGGTGGAGGATTASSSNQAGPYGGQLPPGVGVTPAGGAVPGGAIAASAQWRDIIDQEAPPAGFDPDLVQAIVAKESQGQPGAVNVNDGGPGIDGMGLMQVQSNSEVWSSLGVTSKAQMLDPRTNIKAGIMVLSGKRGIVNKKWPGLSPQEAMHRTLAAYNGSINWDTGQATSSYATDVEGTTTAIHNSGNQNALRTTDSLEGDTSGGGGGNGAGTFTFMGQVELVVIQNGQETGRPLLQFGVTQGGKFARIRNYPTPGTRS